MKIPQLARYNNVVAEAYDFVEKNIKIFPIDIINIIRKFNWGLITYEQMAINNNCKIEDICECLGTDGYSIYNGKNYTIAYNNTIKSQGRINFTLAHEIGHIILNHHKDFEVTEVLGDNFSKEEYKILENEANCFARNILAPSPLVNKLSFFNKIIDIDTTFNITYPAMLTRLNLLKNDLYYLTDEKILNMQNIFQRYNYCRNCKRKHMPTNYQYCINCGSNKLVEGAGFMIYKTKIELDNHKKAKKCPKCDNEEILEGNYCKICGLELFNKCTNIIDACKEISDANARYCHRCGGKTLFYKELILKDYTDEKHDNFIADILGHNTNEDDLPF